MKTGKNFYGCCRYVCSKGDKVSILESDGVRNYDHKLMAADFEMFRRQRPTKELAVFHGILSFYPGETLDDSLMADIGKEYLDELGITNTQFVIAKHTDKAHTHLHIIANMVGFGGRSIKDCWIGLRGKKAAQKLTEKYALIPAKGKKIVMTNLQALNDEEATRYEIYQAISTHLKKCLGLGELRDRLKNDEIEVSYKYKTNSDQPQGISFKKGKFCFKGSSVDRSFSIGGLRKILLANKINDSQARDAALEQLMPKLKTRKKRKGPRL